MTSDNHEMIMATNFIGHVILNNELLDLIKTTGKEGPDFARIIVVSSNWSRFGNLHLVQGNNFDLNMDRQVFDSNLQYNNSKTAQIFYAKKMAEVLDGTNVSITALCPGIDVSRVKDQVSIR